MWKSSRLRDNEKTISAEKRAKEAATASAESGEKKVATLKSETVLARAMKNGGDVENGKRMYVSQGRIAYHAIEPDAVQMGSYLGSAARSHN